MQRLPKYYLTCYKLMVNSLLFHKFLVSSEFVYSSSLQTIDDISCSYCRQSMRYYYCCSALPRLLMKTDCIR